jgi:glycosyltransferase involved in cell wall biosynthesis
MGALLIRWLRTSRLKGTMRRAAASTVALTWRRNTTPQLLVDISVLYQRDAQTGIQRVVRGILLQLLEHGASNHIVRPVFATRDHGYRYANMNFLTDTSATAEWRAQPTLPVEYAAGDIFLGLDLAAHLLPRHREQVARWKASGVAIHILVYDLLPVTHARWFQRKTVRNFRRWLKFLAEFCDDAICISTQTERDLRFGVALKFPDRIALLGTSVIRLGGDLRSTAPSRGIGTDGLVFLAQCNTRSFILMVGTVEPRKGHDAAIDAFERLWASRGTEAPNLVIVGRPGWKTDRLQARLRSHPAIAGRLMWFDNASDELLDLLYRACNGVIVPSYAEGFGLPVEEARGYRKPVLARDLPVFREAGRQAISFFRDDADLPVALACWTAALPGQHDDYQSAESWGWDVTCRDLYKALRIEAPATVDRIFVSKPAIEAA